MASLPPPMQPSTSNAGEERLKEVQHPVSQFAAQRISSAAGLCRGPSTIVRVRLIEEEQHDHTTRSKRKALVIARHPPAPRIMVRPQASKELPPGIAAGGSAIASWSTQPIPTPPPYAPPLQLMLAQAPGLSLPYFVIALLDRMGKASIVEHEVADHIHHYRWCASRCGDSPDSETLAPSTHELGTE